MKTEFAIGHGRDADTVAQSRMMDPAEVAETGRLRVRAAGECADSGA